MKKLKNFYELLELNRDARPEQIKASYRRLAKKFHPDLNPNNPEAVNNFRAVQEAYETLSNTDKKREYDEKLAPRQDHTHRSRKFDDMEDWYYASASYYNETETAKPPRRHYVRATQPRQSYLHHQVELSLQELFKGTKRKITVGRTHTCGKCRGSGRQATDGKPCPRCGAFGFLVTFETVEVDIPPGVMPEMSIRVDMAHWDESQRHPMHMPFATGFYVTIHLRSDSNYTIDGRDLRTRVGVPQTTLESGGSWKLEAPEGGELTFTIPPQSKNGDVIKLKRQGLRSGASHKRGSLYCTLVAED